MDITSSHMDLSGKLLIAMPGMGDPRFEHSVVYMCAHSDDGAMGLIINKVAKELSFADLLEQLDIARTPSDADIHVHFGGPVEHSRGFVLHSSDYHSEQASTMEIDTRFGLTATLDILQDIAQGSGPRQSLLALGYAGWGPGQLEDEIGENGWLTCDASPDLVFDSDNKGKWGAALKRMGVDPRLLSSEAGHA